MWHIQVFRHQSFAIKGKNLGQIPQRSRDLHILNVYDAGMTEHITSMEALQEEKGRHWGKRVSRVGPASDRRDLSGAHAEPIIPASQKSMLHAAYPAWWGVAWMEGRVVQTPSGGRISPGCSAHYSVSLLHCRGAIFSLLIFAPIHAFSCGP